MKTLEFGNEVTQNCVKNKACGMKVKFDSTSFIKRPARNETIRPLESGFLALSSEKEYFSQILISSQFGRCEFSSKIEPCKNL